MNLYHYEFEEEEINCCCARCEKLNIIETRNFMFENEIEDENEKEMAVLNEKNRQVRLLRKDFDELVKEIQQNRLDILAFGEKYNLLNINV